MITRRGLRAGYTNVWRRSAYRT